MPGHVVVQSARLVKFLTALLVILIAVGTPAHAEVTAEKSDRGVTIKINGELFSEYLIKSGNKPVLYPLIGPTGKAMTRAYPLEAKEGEKNDHIHQRSLWFTHGDVNGVSFWDENPKSGTIEHQEFLEVRGGDTAQVIARNDWRDATGHKICEETRAMNFGANEASRWLDFKISLTASEGVIVFGDTKEGSFGIRIAETIKVEAGKGGKIVSSEGKTDVAAWGQRAAWVDYHGPVDDEQVGIAILNHPSSFRYPTWWHVRPYGLFAANPFGQKSFEPGSDTGAHTLPRGETLTLRYRVILHAGDEKTGKIADAFESYAKER